MTEHAAEPAPAPTQHGVGHATTVAGAGVAAHPHELAAVLRNPTPAALHVLDHAALLSAFKAGPVHWGVGPLAAALLLVPPGEHACVTEALGILDLDSRTVFDALHGEHLDYDSASYERLAARFAPDRGAAAASVREVCAAAAAMRDRTGDTAVNTAHLFLGLLHVVADTDEHGLDGYFRDCGITVDLMVSAAVAARARTGDPDRRGGNGYGIAGGRRGPAPRPSERFGVSASSAPTTLRAKVRRRRQRATAPTLADIGTAWRGYTVRRWTVLAVIGQLIALSSLAWAITAIVAGAPWWLFPFALVAGRGYGFSARAQCTTAIASAVAATVVFVLCGAWILVLTTGATVAVSVGLLGYPLDWRRGDTGDPGYGLDRMVRDQVVSRSSVAWLLRWDRRARG
ncbi:hypothetical protein Athai_09990 [Actinocatenispora thailandica]|uniref:Uncharacterized protein n=1 Tax=Actinocatenispora thailandica TaxID=227318 RepID=A0A7R7DL54_9ACTN|nr:hypothetical protein [Actinocatenispora thailandica]BCJ33496.1 hypothetical protein Athai_09990 [Actinocatenispora thailandica]